MSQLNKFLKFQVLTINYRFFPFAKLTSISKLKVGLHLLVTRLMVLNAVVSIKALTILNTIKKLKLFYFRHYQLRYDLPK